MTLTRALATATVAATVALSVAPAAHAQTLRATYHVSGDVEGRFENGSLALTPPAPDGSMTAKGTELRKAGPVEWSGTARLDGRVLTIRRAPATPTSGLTGSVEGRANAPVPGSLEYVALLDESLETGSARVYRVGADGARTELGTARLAKKALPWQKLPGSLLALARKEVDKAIHKEIDLSAEFSLLDYAHIGARVSADLLKDSERTALMKESDRLFRVAGKGEPFWFRSTVEGGPRVAYSTSVPVDPQGLVRLDAGFSLGGHVRYVCDDQHRLPDGVTDAKGALALLEAVPARVIQLPLDAATAESLTMGTRRTLDGWGALAISGGVSFGHRLEELGVLEKKAEVGVTAGLSVNWNIRGDLRLEVERDHGKRVRVRWTKTRQKGVGVAAQALIGLYVSQDLISKVPGPADRGVEAVVKQGEKYTRVLFNASAQWMDSKELVLDFLFDLAEPRARAAFEAAVLGNLSQAQALWAATDKGGLADARITTTLTDALSVSATFKAFEFLKFSYASRSADVRVEVESLDGTRSTTESATYTKTRHGLFGGENSLTAEAVDREVVRADGVKRGIRVRFQVEHKDDKGYFAEVDRQLLLAGTLFGEAAVAEEVARIEKVRREQYGNYGKTRLALDVTLGARAIERLLAATDDVFFHAYARAHWEKSYRWTAARRKVLDQVSTFQRNDESYAEQLEREEADALRDARSVLKLVRKAGKAGTRAEKVEAFRKIARQDGFKMRAVVAFALVAGSDDVRVAYTLSGKNLSFERTVGEAAALPEHD